MIKKSKKTEEEDPVDSEKKEERSSVAKRKKETKQKKLSRFSGLILLVITMLLGFLLWVGGEVKNPKESQKNVIEKNTKNIDSSVIIIE